MRSVAFTLLTLLSLLLLAVGSAAAQPAGAAENSAYVGVRAEVADDGLRVTEVWPGGPAAEAGLQVDDVVRELGGKPVRTLAALGRALAERRPGDVVVLLVRRGERSSTVEVRLGRRRDAAPRSGDRPDGPKEPPAPSATGTGDAPPYIGVEVSDARRGVRVEAVRDVSPAAAAGLAAGDVLHRLGDAAIRSMADLEEALSGRHAGDRVRVMVERNGEDVSLALVLGTRDRPSATAGRGAEAVLAPAKGGLRVETAGEVAGVRLQEGDLVTRVGDLEVATRAALERALAAASGPTTLSVVRGEATVRLDVAGATAAAEPTRPERPAPAGESSERPDRRRRERTRDLGADMTPSKRGLRVQSVRVGSPAERVGLRVGDEVLQVDETPTATRDDFDRAVRQAEGPVTLAVLRDGERIELRLERRRGGARQARAAERAGRGAGGEERGADDGDLGIAFSEGAGGVRIASVRVGGPAERAGLRAGDVVTHVDEVEVREADTFRAKVDSAARSVVRRLIVRVGRKGTRLDLPLDVPGSADVPAADRRRRPTPDAAPDDAVVRAFGAAGRIGVVLVEVDAGGPAARFGLRAGDVVVAVDGAPVDGAADLRRVIASSPPQTLSVVRGGRELQLRLRGGAPGGPGGAAGRPWMGVELTPSARGLEVTAVRRDSPAARAGLRVGDRLTAIGGRAVSSGDALAEVIDRHAPGDRVRVTVDRDGASLDLPVVLGRRGG